MHAANGLRLWQCPKPRGALEWTANDRDLVLRENKLGIASCPASWYHAACLQLEDEHGFFRPFENSPACVSSAPHVSSLMKRSNILPNFCRSASQEYAVNKTLPHASQILVFFSRLDFDDSRVWLAVRVIDDLFFFFNRPSFFSLKKKKKRETCHAVTLSTDSCAAR